MTLSHQLWQQTNLCKRHFIDVHWKATKLTWVLGSLLSNEKITTINLSRVFFFFFFFLSDSWRKRSLSQKWQKKKEEYHNLVCGLWLRLARSPDYIPVNYQTKQSAVVIHITSLAELKGLLSKCKLEVCMVGITVRSDEIQWNANTAQHCFCLADHQFYLLSADSDSSLHHDARYVFTDCDSCFFKVRWHQWIIKIGLCVLLICTEWLCMTGVQSSPSSWVWHWCSKPWSASLHGNTISPAILATEASQIY